jgi:O-antigen/teichoic acid export membrane protein
MKNFDWKARFSLIDRGLERFRHNPLFLRVVRNSSYLFSANTLSAGLSMGQSILAARILGVAAFGVLGTVTQFASVINKVTSFRMGELVVSYLGEFNAAGKKQHAAALFKMAGLIEIVSSIFAFIILVLLAPLGAALFAKDPDTANIFVIYGVSILANLIVESATGLLQTFDRFRAIAISTVVQSVVTLLLISSAFLFGGGLIEIAIAYLIGKAVWAGSISVLAFREAARQWGSNWWRAPISLLADRRRELIRFGFSTNVSGTINLATRDSDVLWLSALSSPLQVGYYKVAKAFMNILLIPVTPLISTTYREVAREVAARQWANVRYLLRSGSLLASAWTLPTSLGLVIFGRWLVTLYGVDFLPAYPVLLVLLLGVIAVNVLYWNRSVLLPLGMPDFPMKISVVIAASQLAAMYLLVPDHGALAMAGALSWFFIGTAGILVWKTQVELKRVSANAHPGGDPP